MVALENIDGAKRTHTRLIAIDCCEEIGATFLDEFFYFFHVILLNEIF